MEFPAAVAGALATAVAVTPDVVVAALPNLNAITHGNKQGRWPPVEELEELGRPRILLFVACSVSHFTVGRTQQSGRLS